MFVLSDDQDLLPEEMALLQGHGVQKVSLSRTVLHSYQAITASHLLMDMSPWSQEGE
jgi:tRNA pseudouridine-54 N-methylase